MSSQSESSLEQIETEVRQVTAEEHHEEVRLIEDLLTCCLRGFTLIGSLTLTDTNRLQQAQLVAGNEGFQQR